jgi:hypothetical protein
MNSIQHISASKSKSIVNYPYINEIYRTIYNVHISYEGISEFPMYRIQDYNISLLPS